MNNKRLKLSIVLSTFNGQDNIIDQLESIRKQNRKADEVLIFDDCSTDNTVLIIENYIKKFHLDKWKLTINKSNKGWRKNFIDGMKLSSGDLIFPCDQDDIWDVNKLDKMEIVMKKYSFISVLVSNYEEFYGNSKRKNLHFNDIERVHKICVKKGFMDIEYPGCTYCIRKDFFYSVVGFWKENMPHDSLLWRMAMFSDSLYAYDKKLISQRKHNDSAFTIEANKSRNKNAKIEEIKYTKDVISSIECYIKMNNYETPKKILILENAKMWITSRQNFFENRKIREWIYLIKYFKYYPNLKKYFLDLYVVIKESRLEFSER